MRKYGISEAEFERKTNAVHSILPLKKATNSTTGAN